jgi:hypothetical protein
MPLQFARRKSPATKKWRGWEGRYNVVSDDRCRQALACACTDEPVTMSTIRQEM